jgi:hypothetical protein
MTNVAPPKPGDQVTEILKAVVAERLEAIFPGLGSYEQAVRARASTPPGNLGQALPGYADGWVAKAHARIDSDQIGEDQVGERNDAIARRVLRSLWTLQEDVLTVSHLQRCFRIPASHLVDFVIHGAGVTGDKSLDGDDLFVGAHSMRVIVFHHEGWVFDVMRERDGLELNPA